MINKEVICGIIMHYDKDRALKPTCNIYSGLYWFIAGCQNNTLNV